MTHVLQIALPLVELICAGYLWARTARKYPALVIYLLTEATWHALAITDYTVATRIGVLPRMLFRFAVVQEVFLASRTRWGYPEILKTAASVLAASGIAAIGMLRAIHLSPWQSLFVFRQYYYVALAAGMWALIVSSSVWPKLERRQTRAYRWGIAAWMTAIAIPGTFVRGGLGYLIFPHTEAVWHTVDMLAYGCITVTVLALGLSLGGWPVRLPKAAAKRPEVSGRVLVMGRRVA